MQNWDIGSPIPSVPLPPALVSFVDLQNQFHRSTENDEKTPDGGSYIKINDTSSQEHKCDSGIQRILWRCKWVKEEQAPPPTSVSVDADPIPVYPELPPSQLAADNQL